MRSRRRRQPSLTAWIVFALVIVSACSVLLDGFATSADEDAALLETARRKGSDSLSDVRRVASLRSRLSRKRCLRQLRDACAPP